MNIFAVIDTNVLVSALRLEEMMRIIAEQREKEK